MNENQSLNTGKIVGVVSSLMLARMFGLFLLLPVVILYMGQLQAEPWLAGVALAAYPLAQAFLQIPFGRWSDQVGRRKAILTGLVLFLAGAIISALATSAWVFVLGRALQGAGAVAGVLMALVADVTTPEKRARSMAAVGASIGMAFVLSLVIGPLLVAGVGVGGLLWVVVALAGFALVVALVSLPEIEPVVAPRLSLAEVLADGRFFRLNISVFCLHMVMASMFFLVPQWLQELHDLPLVEHWWVYGLALLGSIFGMVPLILQAEKHGRANVVVCVAVIAMVTSQLLLLGGLTVPWLLGLALILFFVGFNVLEALYPSALSRMAGDNKGAVSGAFSTFQFAGAAFGALANGFLFSLLSPTTLLLCNAFVTLLCLASASIVANAARSN